MTVPARTDAMLAAAVVVVVTDISAVTGKLIASAFRVKIRVCPMNVDKHSEIFAVLVAF